MGNRDQRTEPWARGAPRAASAVAAGLHLTALIGLSVAQPLYDLIGRNAEFLVAHDVREPDVVAFILVLSALLPMLLLAIEALAGLIARPASLWLHRGLVGLLLAALALLAFRRSPLLPGWLLAGLAVALGFTGAATYARRDWLRRFIGILSPAALVFPLVFVLATPVATLMWRDPVTPRDDLRVDSTAPIVMVIFDELAAFSIMDDSQRINALRYPHLAALAADAYWFRNATTVSTSTAYAVPAILSGRYPGGRLLPTASDYPETLLTLLGGSYDLHVFESFTRLCPEGLCHRPPGPFGERFGALLRDLRMAYLHLLLPADLARGLPSINATWRDFGGRRRAAAADGLEGAPPEFFPRTAGQFDRFLEALRSGRDSTLYLIHILLPHVPWRYLPSGKQYGPEEMRMHPHGVDGESEVWGEDEWPIVQAQQRYLLQVGHVDRLIGEITATLKQAGLYESCLWVVVADHGVSFRPGDNRRNVTATNFAEAANVPLLVKLPGQREGTISDRNVQTIDVLPTIADALGLAIPWPVDGRSALDEQSAGENQKQDCPSCPSQPLVFDADRLAARAESVERMRLLFGSGSEPDGLFRIGPRPELLGRATGGRVDADDSPLTADLDGVPASTWTYDPQSAFAPTHFTGRVTGPGAGEASLELAIAVNGVVRAVTRTFDRGPERARFSAMVPESALEPGPNQVELFVASQTDNRALLRRVPTVNDVFSLGKLANGGEALFRHGQAIAVVGGEVTGSIELVQRLPGGWATFEGWAADFTEGRAADRIVIFAGDRLAGVRAPQHDRPDLARRFSRPGILHSGFDVKLSPRFFPDERSYPVVRIFAVSRRGVASELALPRGPAQ